MSIERSIFNSKTEVASFVESKYGIIPTEVERLYGGSANCYRLTVGGSYYFLKEFPRNFDKAALLREARICTLLAEKGISSSVFIKTLKNDLFFIKSRFFCLIICGIGLFYKSKVFHTRAARAWLHRRFFEFRKSNIRKRSVRR